MTGFAHSPTTNKNVNEAANDSAQVSGQEGKMPSIGLQDLEDSARSQRWKKINKAYFCIIILKFV